MLDKICVVSCLVLAISVLSYFVNNEVPLPYMDEIFHVPQAQRYCNGNFSYWDPMITTPPGLYLVSILIIQPISWLLSSDLCITSVLRAQSIIFTIGLFLLFCDLSKSLNFQTRQSSSIAIATLSSFTLVTFPPLFFFNFLYYTDIGSTFAVVLAYRLTRGDHHFLSSLVLIISVMFRQTNIIWGGFIAGTVVLNRLEPALTKKITPFSQYWKMLVTSCWYNIPVIFSMVWSYLLLAIGFCLFILINGGVVLGDKSHHTVTFNLPQLLYFSCFVCAFSVGPFLSRIKLFIKSFSHLSSLLLLILISIYGIIAVHYYTYEHPYLLADNRHYTFYIWKNIFRRNISMKYILIPAYGISMLAIITALSETRSYWWILLFLSSCFLALVPQSLLEFRYYIIPYILFRLHVKPPPVIGILSELFTYCVINFVTLWLFLKRPFQWEGHDDQLQRFMW